MTRDDEVVELLEAAGRAMEAPDVDVVPAVLARIDAPAGTRLSVWTRVAVALVAGLLLLAAASAAGLVPGLRLVRSERPPADIEPIGDTTELGRPATLDDAAVAAGLDDVLVPDAGELVDPEVFVDGRIVHLAYPASPDLPELGDSGIGLLVTQWAAQSEDDVLVKAVPGEDLQQVQIGDVTGWWITGPHEVAPFGDQGAGRWRRTDDVLVWQRDGVSVRVEARLPLDDVRALAGSLGP